MSQEARQAVLPALEALRARIEAARADPAAEVSLGELLEASLDLFEPDFRLERDQGEREPT